jgi:hypothetical protein
VYRTHVAYESIQGEDASFDQLGVPSACMLLSSLAFSSTLSHHKTMPAATSYQLTDAPDAGVKLWPLRFASLQQDVHDPLLIVGCVNGSVPLHSAVRCALGTNKVVRMS